MVDESEDHTGQRQLIYFDPFRISNKGLKANTAGRGAPPVCQSRSTSPPQNISWRGPRGCRTHTMFSKGFQRSTEVTRFTFHNFFDSPFLGRFFRRWYSLSTFHSDSGSPPRYGLPRLHSNEVTPFSCVKSGRQLKSSTRVSYWRQDNLFLQRDVQSFLCLTRRYEGRAFTPLQASGEGLLFRTHLGILPRLRFRATLGPDRPSSLCLQ